MRSTILHVICHISSRVFLCTELCRNEEWLAITKEHTMNGFDAVNRLREGPSVLRPFVHWFLPGCQKARSHIIEVTNIMKPIVKKRRALKTAAIAEGRNPPKLNDAIDWFEQAYKGEHCDPSVSQLFPAKLAMHTTSDLLGQALVDLARNPEMSESLRKEVLGVLRDGGWKKSLLYRMKLLDSVVKESQCHTPDPRESTIFATMQRITVDDVTLSDGTFIPKGTSVYVSSYSLFDPNIYKNPKKWDGYRFLRMREQPGMENIAQLVSTSLKHLGFGYGKYSCPGRFFAANEIKIALYEWRLPADAQPIIIDYAETPTMNPALELEIRGRDEEVNLKF
ncbi:cytochrome P450 monooxygenase TRI1 [Colletotrichum spaethianum]|uniref:Cytochrome P450 monooxygenase TRI1 n=1 Tax=Colletotrichum spaethianum TaxID=700344 RepID=A0AA37L6F3_9PEZI|nr:cytochrome P450 monooxygenase TRI1 [Colletotrichum spaethianum]GKT42707.1 cytochrome P450 monooxygenase TRI1 [Colletotrichum spaethianum]